MRPSISYVIVVLLCLPVNGYSRILPDTVSRRNFYSQQETEEVLVHGKKYLDFNIKSLNKHNKRVSRQQEKLLNKLKRKEKVYASRLECKDSAAYILYQQQSLSFDSIRRISRSSTNVSTMRKSESNIDSLIAIQRFLSDKFPYSTDSNYSVYANKLANLKSDQQYNNYIGDLINQQFNNLKNINVNAKNIGGFKSIDKQVFYAKEKIKVFKQINDEPSKVEEKALEILQGQQGFDKWMDHVGGKNIQSGNISASDLEKMGYQTKRQATEQLQQKFGSNLGSVQQNIGKQIDDYQDKIKDLQTKANSVKQTKQSITQLKNLSKPRFKINPMRGLPLSKRIEKQFNWQTSRATTDGNPAILQMAAMAGFKHTPHLIYGVGLATAIGLGQNWNDIKFSFEGIGIRSFTEWQWRYGIGIYGGYERVIKTPALGNFNDPKYTEQKHLHDTEYYYESVVLGLTKGYNVTKQWNGKVQLLYDVWWKEKGEKSPIMIRIVTAKK